MVTFGCEIWVPGINGQKPCCSKTSRHKEIKYVGSDHPRFPSLRMRTPSLPASMMTDRIEDDDGAKIPKLVTEDGAQRSLGTLSPNSDIARPKKTNRFLTRFFGGSTNPSEVTVSSPSSSAAMSSPISEPDMFKQLGLPPPNENWHRHGTFTLRDSCGSSQDSGTSLTESVLSSAEDSECHALAQSADSGHFGDHSAASPPSLISAVESSSSTTLTCSIETGFESRKCSVDLKKSVESTVMQRQESQRAQPTTPTKALKLRRILSLSASTILGSESSNKASIDAAEAAPETESGASPQICASNVCSNGSGSLGISFDKPTKLLSKYGVCSKGDKGVIGRGATACVKIVHCLKNKDSGEKFAVKEFRKISKSESRRHYVKRLASEFCISSSLKHPNIVQTVDLVIDESERWCEVMEYCGGGDLYSVIRSCELSTDDIGCIFKQLLNGVAYLHSVGVAHRDLKPENLLFNNSGLLKITDFGVSEVFRTAFEMDPHMSHGLCGSEPYIAPEEFASKEYDAQEVDIWACGIVYYAMTYSGVPWQQAVSTDPNYGFYCRHRDPPAFPPFSALDPGCAGLMYQILNPDPNQRIKLKDILADPWFASIITCCDSVYSEFGHDGSLLGGTSLTTCTHKHITKPRICS